MLTVQTETIAARCLEAVDRVHAIESTVDGRSFKANSSGSTRNRLTVVTVNSDVFERHFDGYLAFELIPSHAQDYSAATLA